jgi:uncharacterized membrane protein YGL010W
MIGALCAPWRIAVNLLSEHMVSYARYHRDPRNIATHFVGIPMIVLAVSTLLSLVQWSVAGLPITPAWLLVGLTLVLYYRRLGMGCVFGMGLLLGLSNLLGQRLAAEHGLAWGLGLFVVGWAIQFFGHLWEGRKPAFADDLRGLLQGPLFIACEALFALGWLQALQAEIEAQAGPVRRNPHRTEPADVAQT